MASQAEEKKKETSKPSRANSKRAIDSDDDDNL